MANYRRKYPRKTKGNKDWLCKYYKSFKTLEGHRRKRKEADMYAFQESAAEEVFIRY